MCTILRNMCSQNMWSTFKTTHGFTIVLDLNVCGRYPGDNGFHAEPGKEEAEGEEEGLLPG